jgi:hypothetical protein
MGPADLNAYILFKKNMRQHMQQISAFGLSCGVQKLEGHVFFLAINKCMGFGVWGLGSGARVKGLIYLSAEATGDRTPDEKGLRDRNSPTCTLSQNGYGANSGKKVVRRSGLSAAGHM